MRDPYRTLGVAPDADLAAIKLAYRRLAKSLHPDHNPGNRRAEQRFREVTEAYETLANPLRRAAHDRGRLDAARATRRPAPSRAGPARPQAAPGAAGPTGADDETAPGSWWSDGLESMLERVFSQGGGRAAGGGRAREAAATFTAAFSRPAADGSGRPERRRRPRGADQHLKLEVDFLAAVRGGRQTLSTPDQRQLEVELPAGVEDGKLLRLRGQGLPGPNDGPRGDLLVHIRVAAHSRFRRQGSDIHLDLPVSLAEAVRGAKVTVPTIDGPVRIAVPAGANTGQVLRLKGRGVALRTGQRGDQYVRLLLVLPTPPDPALSAFLERWAEGRDDPVRREDDG